MDNPNLKVAPKPSDSRTLRWPGTMLRGSELGNVWYLLTQLTRREVEGRYKGSLGGVFWSFLYPIAMLSIYVFVFSVIFKSSWPGTGTDDRMGAAFRMSVGILLHGMLAECVSRSPALMISYANYVKKIRFPLWILPAVVVFTAAFHFLIGFALLSGAVLYGHFSVIANMPLALLSIGLLMVSCFAISLCLSALGTYVRDIAQITGIVVPVLLFLSPCLYPLSIVPEQYRFYLYLNPLTIPVISVRSALFNETAPDWTMLAAYGGLTLLALLASYALFKKLRSGFADFL